MTRSKFDTAVNELCVYFRRMKGDRWDKLGVTKGTGEKKSYEGQLGGFLDNQFPHQLLCLIL